MKQLAPPVVAALLGLLLWELLARGLHIEPWLLPPPSAVARAALAARAELVGATLTTGTTAFLGFSLSAVVGVSLGVLLSRSRLLERGFYPYALLLQTVPIVAIAPLLVLWFGIGPRAVTASAFIVSVFPVVTGTLSGLRSVDPALHDLFTLYGSSRTRRLLSLELPSAAFSIATGLRVASGLAVIGAVVGEFVAGFAEGRPGLGIVVMSSYRQLRTDVLFGAVFCSTLLGLALFSLVAVFSHLYLHKWHVAEKDPR